LTDIVKGQVERIAQSNVVTGMTPTDRQIIGVP